MKGILLSLGLLLLGTGLRAEETRDATRHSTVVAAAATESRHSGQHRDPAHSERSRRPNRPRPSHDCPAGPHERGYTVWGGALYYDGQRVEGASATSFSDLGGGYGKDPWTVFYLGRKVEGASAMNFRRVGGGYARDPWTVFYRGRKVEGASAMNFEYLGRGYARDSWAVYFKGRKIDSSPATFRMPGNR